MPDVGIIAAAAAESRAKRVAATVAERVARERVEELYHAEPPAEGKAGLDGPEGPEGKAGEVGPEGPTGPEGSRGPKGPKGDKGDRGDIGPKGERGPMGPAGSGRRGNPGSPGYIARGGGATGGPGGSFTPADDPGDFPDVTTLTPEQIGILWNTFMASLRTAGIIT